MDKSPNVVERKVRVVYGPAETSSPSAPAAVATTTVTSDMSESPPRKASAPYSPDAPKLAVDAASIAQATASQTSPLSSAPVSAEDKAEVARLRALLDKSQRELVETRSELRQRSTAVSKPANTTTSATQAAAHHAAGNQFSLLVLVAVAIVAFFIGGLIF
jgi:hypothetical protein